MTSLIPRRLPVQSQRRGAALFVTVISVALIVSLLGLAGLTLVRIERRQAAAASDLLIGRRHSRSAVELGLAAVHHDSGWRSSNTSGVESTARSPGGGVTGTLSWVLQDSDGSLTNSDVDVRLRGIGRVGSVVQVSSVAIASSGAPSAERIWLDEYRPGTASQFSLQSGTAIAARVAPAIQPGAVRWSITRIAVWCSKGNVGALEAQIMTCDANGRPQHVIDSVTISTSLLPASAGWYQVTFPDAIGLAPGESICAVLRHGAGSGTIAQVTRGTNSTASPATSVLTSADGGSTWTVESHQDLWIKIYGTYTTSNTVSARNGAWTWDAAP